MHAHGVWIIEDLDTEVWIIEEGLYVLASKRSEQGTYRSMEIFDYSTYVKEPWVSVRMSFDIQA